MCEHTNSVFVFSIHQLSYLPFIKRVSCIMYLLTVDWPHFVLFSEVLVKGVSLTLV